MKNQLVISAFDQAYGKESPQTNLIVHTNQGTPFTSENFEGMKLWSC